MERCQGSTHADGSWVPRAAPPYEIMPAAFYARFQDASHSLPRSFHGAAAGLTCDDRSFTRRKEPRKHYEWRPRACALDAWDRTRACALLEERDVRQVVVVGDSISEQIYVSLVMLLQGLDGFGPPVNGSTRVVAAKGAELHSKAAVACDGRVRLSYARNDLLLWSSSGAETNLVRWCAGNTILEPWAVRAVHDADLLVLGAGIHAVSSLESINSSAAAAFPAHNLRHTLRRLVAERAKRGAAPESVVLLGAPLPTPGCESIGAPLTLSGAALHAGRLKAHPFAAQWRQLQHFNQAAQWVAQDAGVVWIDVAALSRTRPDAAVAAHGLGTPASRGRVSSVGDCVHTCQPGPIDEYVRLLFHEVCRPAMGSCNPVTRASCSSRPRHTRGGSYPPGAEQDGAARFRDAFDPPLLLGVGGGVASPPPPRAARGRRPPARAAAGKNGLPLRLRGTLVPVPRVPGPFRAAASQFLFGDARRRDKAVPDGDGPAGVSGCARGPS